MLDMITQATGILKSKIPYETQTNRVLSNSSRRLVSGDGGGPKLQTESSVAFLSSKWEKFNSKPRQHLRIFPTIHAYG